MQSANRPFDYQPSTCIDSPGKVIWPNADQHISRPLAFCAKICPKFFELYASTYGSTLVTDDLPGQGLQYTMFWSSSTKLTGLSTSSAHAALNCEKLKPRYGPPCMLRYLTDWQCTVFQLNRAYPSSGDIEGWRQCLAWKQSTQTIFCNLWLDVLVLVSGVLFLVSDGTVLLTSVPSTYAQTQLFKLI